MILGVGATPHPTPLRTIACAHRCSYGPSTYLTQQTTTTGTKPSPWLDESICTIFFKIQHKPTPPLNSEPKPTLTRLSTPNPRRRLPPNLQKLCSQPLQLSVPSKLLRSFARAVENVKFAIMSATSPHHGSALRNRGYVQQIDAAYCIALSNTNHPSIDQLFITHCWV